jgi:hypothetical protein
MAVKDGKDIFMSYQKTKQLNKTKDKKRNPRSERKTIENKLDTLSTKLCRAQGYCTICGKKGCVLNAHHFISRKYKGVRWYQPNLVCLCVHCHTFNFKFSAHKTPEAFEKRMVQLRGKEWLKDIEKKAREHKTWKIEELKQLLKETEEKLK